MIKTKRAYWKSKSGIMDEYEITTIVLEQDGVYFDPSDGDFLDKIFKEYVRDFLQKDEIVLNLSKEDLFYYGENANVYLLNYIYQDLFDTTKKVFDPIARSKEDGSINLSLFNGFDKQVVFLVKILEKMQINFKKLSEDYMLLGFPHSIDCYKEDKVYDVRYEDI